MNVALSSSIRAKGRLSSAAMNCGRNARKKIDSFGLRMLIKNPVKITFAAERGPLVEIEEPSPRVGRCRAAKTTESVRGRCLPYNLAYCYVYGHEIE
jgi:hypothetical protein